MSQIWTGHMGVCIYMGGGIELSVLPSPPRSVQAQGWGCWVCTFRGLLGESGKLGRGPVMEGV
uniref:Uncharacterized protein n=1 Tax=Anguilla anguilla TaxID=7936 RepID=A0A0E9R685_ANGAN